MKRRRQSTSLRSSQKPQGAPKTLSRFDSGRWSLVHVAFALPPAEEPRVGRHYVLPFLVVAIVSLGSIVVAVSIDQPDVLRSQPGLKLALSRDWNTIWQFLVTFPLLIAFLLTERSLIPQRLSDLMKAGILRFEVDTEDHLVKKWSYRFTATNIIAQAVGIAVGLIVANANYGEVRQPDWGSWQAKAGVMHVGGWVWLFWVGAFYWVVSLYFLRALTTIWFLFGITRDRDIELVPFHPDNCGGLRPIGTIGLRNQYILAVGGVNVFLFGLVAYYLNLDELVGLLLAAGLLYILGGPIAFLGPLFPFQSAMKKEKHQILQIIGNALGSRYSQAVKEIADKGMPQQSFAEIERLRKILATARRLPVWPFDIVTLRKFLAAYVGPPLLLIASTALTKAVEQLVDRWSGTLGR